MDLYSILQIKPDCTINDIKKSYYNLAKKYHPDKENGSAEKFQQINYAYTILSCEKTRTQYNIMNKSTKTTFISFLEKFFEDSSNLSILNKLLANINIKSNSNILSDIDCYDFNDIIQLFTNSIIPIKKSTDTIECSDSDVNCWDETQAEYYEMLPIKYHQYNKNNINLELKCSLNDILSSNKLRMIKIKRRFFDIDQINTFNFNCRTPYVVFNQGGDVDTNITGHLIIHFILPTNYIWDKNNIIYSHDINLYQFIYGVDIELNFNNRKYDIKQWIPYRDSMVIPVTDINQNNITMYFIVQLNLIYRDTISKRNILAESFID
jgi:curved DNA-binding protein CbpA